jgi:hypothetical protein
MTGNSLDLLSLLLLFLSADAFQTFKSFRQTTRFVSSSSQLQSSSANTDIASTQARHTVELIRGGEDDPRVLDVASFRNGMKNPVMIVARAKEKRDSVDTTAAAIDGLKIGFLYVGPLIGGFTFMETQQVQEALQNYAVLGGGIGVLLAANNYMGRGIHVPDIPEATK